jgi:hypothetical protein
MIDNIRLLGDIEVKGPEGRKAKADLYGHELEITYDSFADSDIQIQDIRCSDNLFEIFDGGLDKKTIWYMERDLERAEYQERKEYV